MNAISAWEHDFCSLNNVDEIHLFDYTNESCLLSYDYYYYLEFKVPVHTEKVATRPNNNAEWPIYNTIQSLSYQLERFA